MRRLDLSSVAISNQRRRARQTYYVFRLIAPFVFAMWLTMANLYFATIITQDPFRLATLLVVLEAATFVFEVPTGVVADSFSRKWSMVIGYLIWGGGFLLQALVPVYEIALLSQAIWGLGFSFVSGAPEAWLVDELGQEEASSLFLRGSQLGHVTTLFGIAAATALATLHVSLPIAIGGFATICLAILLAVIMPEERFQPTRRRGMPIFQIRRTVAASVKHLQDKPVLRSIVLIGVVIGCSVGGFDAMYAPHILQNLALPVFEPEIWFGILFGTVTLLTIPVVEMIKRVLQWQTQIETTSILALFAAITVLGNLIFVWTSAFYIAALAYCLSQVMRTASKPLFMIWVNRYAPSDVRATVISMYWQSNAFGQILGAPVLGAIGTLSSLRIALFAASLALLPSIPLYRRRRKDSSELNDSLK